MKYTSYSSTLPTAEHRQLEHDKKPMTTNNVVTRDSILQSFTSATCTLSSTYSSDEEDAARVSPSHEHDYEYRRISISAPLSVSSSDDDTMDCNSMMSAGDHDLEEMDTTTNHDNCYDSECDDKTVPTHNMCQEKSARYETRRQVQAGNHASVGFRMSEMWCNFIERAHQQAARSSSENLTSQRRQRRPSTFQNSSKFPTPLYEAISLKANLYVLRRLIVVHPAAVRIPNAVNGSLPLHCAIDRYDIFDPTGFAVVEFLLNADPTTVNSPNKNGITPIGLLWDKYLHPRQHADATICNQRQERAETIKKTMEYLILHKNYWAKVLFLDGKNAGTTADNVASDVLPATSATNVTTNSADFFLFWKLFSKFSCAAFDGMGLPVHAALSFQHQQPADLLLIKFVCSLFPSHLLVKEPKIGATPLHILAMKQDMSNTCPNYQVDMMRLLYIILDACPQATMVKDKRGRIPLHVALRSGSKAWPFLAVLIKANPKALHEADGSTKLVPFLLASAIEANCSSTHVNTTTVYSLLRSDPSVMESFLQS